MLLAFAPEPMNSTNSTRRLLSKAEPAMHRVLSSAHAIVKEMGPDLQTNHDGRRMQSRPNFHRTFMNDMMNTRNQPGDLPETHQIPPEVPEGCDYAFNHGSTVFTDEVSCPNWCGDGRNFLFTVTTLCSGSVCESFDDCRIDGCTDECSDDPGGCPCATMDFDAVCAATCPAEPTGSPVMAPVQTDAPTTAPVETDAPTSAPVETDAPVAAPVETDAPVAAPVEIDAPVAAPVETDAPEAAPVDVVTESPVMMTRENHTANETLPRQTVILKGTVFRNNRQGIPLNRTTRGVITTNTGFNDLELEFVEFLNNEFAVTGVSQ